MFVTSEKLYITSALKKFAMINISLIIFLTIHVVHCINNGCPGAPGEFKYLVSVRRFGEILCSGTVIHESYILTIGHVISPFNSTELGIIGDIAMETYPRFTYFPVDNVYFHPEFQRINFPDDDGYWRHDFALIKLKQKIAWTSNIGPIQLTNSELHSSSAAAFLACQIVSWSHSMKYYDTAIVPVSDFAEIIWNEFCAPWNMFLLPNEKCFNDYFRTAIISSQDLGSPIICEDMVVGLTVRTNTPPTAARPSIFLSLFPYRDLITAVLHGRMDANTGEFPYVVSIWIGNHYQCGGMILDATHIITAGHCFDLRKLGQYKVAFGLTTVQPVSPWISWLSINDAKRAPGYRNGHGNEFTVQRQTHDIAVMTLRGQVSWGPNIGHIDIPVNVPFLHGQICEVLHWEPAENEFGGAFMKLQRNFFMLMDRYYCQQLGLQPLGYEFCARPVDVHSIIQPGDRGNPIICKGEPLGIVVRAYPPPLPAIFIRLQPYRDFIMGFLG